MISANRRGFTLVELMVVLVIFGILVGLLVPALMYARDAARRTQCMNNQQQVSKAILLYDLHKRHLPWVVSTVTGTKLSSNWVIDIFPEMDRMDLYKRWLDTTVSHTAVKVPELICPTGDVSDPLGGLSYIVNLGNSASKYDTRLFRFRFDPTLMENRLAVSDLRSTGSLVMLSERLSAGPWTTLTLPKDITDPNNPLCFWWPLSSTTNTLATAAPPPYLVPNLSSHHRGGINVTFFDGSTKTIPPETRCWNDPENPVRGAP